MVVPDFGDEKLAMSGLLLTSRGTEPVPARPNLIYTFGGGCGTGHVQASGLLGSDVLDAIAAHMPELSDEPHMVIDLRQEGKVSVELDEPARHHDDLANRPVAEKTA